MTPESENARTILIAVSDSPFEKRIRRAIDSQGTLIRTAKTGADVILQACKFPGIDLYILSTGLTGMNAFETVVALRQISRDVPIILLTEHITLELLRLATLVGCNELMQNPIDGEELKLVVVKYLSNSYRITKNNSGLKSNVNNGFPDHPGD
jgi:PleD family two-component response regulator